MSDATSPLPEQNKQVLRSVVDALNADPSLVSAADVHRYLTDTGTPVDIADIAAAMDILRLPKVGYQRGVPTWWVMSQIWDVLQGLDGDEPPEFVDDRA
ncbi:hypothetical protein AB0M22_45060 [Nocardia sp. NPDC051756]|uniref:hypothetical protein n=1 Tax=Nocardia sp. NPDC051756 TaxID=3154751 RepID=UPI00343A6FB6